MDAVELAQELRGLTGWEAPAAGLLDFADDTASGDSQVSAMIHMAISLLSSWR